MTLKSQILWELVLSMSHSATINEIEPFAPNYKF